MDQETIVREIVVRRNTYYVNKLLSEGKLVEAVTAVKEALKHFSVKLPVDFWTVDFSERVAARLKSKKNISIEDVAREIVREIFS